MEKKEVLLRTYDYVFEPSVKEILKGIVPFLLEFQIYQTILESNASEHSARMMAMRKASDNYKEAIKDLTLVYNKLRQAQITNELLEITMAKKSLEEIWQK